MATITNVTLKSIANDIRNLGNAFNKQSNNIQSIADHILQGFEQSPQFDGKDGGNAYCQKIPSLVNTVYMFSPSKAKDVIAFFAGKIPFGIISRDGEYRLSKLNWDLIKAPEILQAENKAKAEKRQASIDANKAKRTETLEKAKHADALKIQLEDERQAKLDLLSKLSKVGKELKDVKENPDKIYADIQAERDQLRDQLVTLEKEKFQMVLKLQAEIDGLQLGLNKATIDAKNERDRLLKIIDEMKKDQDKKAA